MMPMFPGQDDGALERATAALQLARADYSNRNGRVVRRLPRGVAAWRATEATPELKLMAQQDESRHANELDRLTAPRFDSRA